MNTTAWRHYRNYIFLFPAFATALFYQIAYTVVAVRVTAHATTTPSRPFASTEQMVTGVDQMAARDGLEPGDKVMAIDGRPFTGDRVLMEEMSKMRPNRMMEITVIHKGDSAPRTLAVHPRFWDATPPNAWRWAMIGTLLGMMLFCTLLGIYVAAVLPHDLRALTVFGLMTSTSQLIAVVSWYQFPRPLWVFADVLHNYGVGSWPNWLILFSLYFPRRFSWDHARPYLKWIVLAPLFAWTGVIIAGSILEFSRFGIGTGIVQALNLPFWSGGGLFALSAAFFFASIFAKMRGTRHTDSCRRLQILLAGSLVSLAPIVGLVLYQSAHTAQQFNRVPEALVIAICLLFCLFPATMAYVVVVERAMRLRVVVRQGVRYALAKGGVRVLIVLIAIAVYWSLSSSVSSLNFSLTTKIALIIGCALIFSSIINRTRKHIMLWLDRRYFRESYNAELLLQELGETVQSIIREDELLDTVTRRISETLHIEKVAVLLSGKGVFRPVYCLGFEVPRETALPENSKTLELIQSSKEPAPIYFERHDNWVHAAGHQEAAILRSLHAQILLPVGSKTKMMGLLSLGPKKSEEPYTSSDVRLLRTVAVQTGLALQNSRLASDIASEMSAREKLRRELEIAREVQQRLFPQILPPIAGIDYFGACRPALEVGGDYYDFLPLANGDLGIAIGDVSGKGIAAALLMASLQASLRGQAMVNQGDLARLMSNVNQLVYEATAINRYATFFYGQYSCSSGVFTYVNAGHNPPILCRRVNGGPMYVIRLDTGGPVIGLIPGVPYQQGSVALEPGDIFVGFTDGISEAMNNEDEEWGESRFIPAIKAYSAYAAADMIPALISEADRFVDGAPQHDDMTLVVMRLGECRLPQVQ